MQTCAKKLQKAEGEEHPRKFATLVIQVPSIYTGGKVRVGDEGEFESNNFVDCDLGQEDAGVADVKGVEFQKSAFAYYYMCFFQGKQVIQEEIKSGSRIFLYYDLLWNEEKISVPRSVGSLKENALVCMRNALSEWKMKEKMALYPFENLYSDVESADSQTFNSANDFFADEINWGMRLDNLLGVDRQVANLFFEIAKNCDLFPTHNPILQRQL
jgi:hypothetical protein